MNKTGIILICIIIFAIIAIMMFSSSSVMQPKGISLREIQVTVEQITLQGDFSEDSAKSYRGYEHAYRNEALYIKIKSGLTLPFLPSTGSFVITIPNTYGNVKEVYLEGTTASENIRIWSK